MIPAPPDSARTSRSTAILRVFGAHPFQTDGEILALPDLLLEVLPKNPLAFRDRNVVTDSPASIKKMIIRRGTRIDELVPESKGSPNAWRMLPGVLMVFHLTGVTDYLVWVAAADAQELREFVVDHLATHPSVSHA